MCNLTTYPMTSANLRLVEDLGVKLDTFLTGSCIGDQQVIEIQGDNDTLEAFHELWCELAYGGK